MKAKCEKCGFVHSDVAEQIALIIINGQNLIETTYGKKNLCGLTDLIDRKMKGE